MTPTSFALKVSEMLPVIHRSIMRRQQGIFAKGQLTFAQSVVLEMLAQDKSFRMTEIARLMRRPKSAVTPIIDGLCRLGMASREHAADDRRVVNVILTRKGRRIAQTIQAEMVSMIDKAFAPLTETEKRQYLAILEKITKHIEK